MSFSSLFLKNSKFQRSQKFVRAVQKIYFWFVSVKNLFAAKNLSHELCLLTLIMLLTLLTLLMLLTLLTLLNLLNLLTNRTYQLINLLNLLNLIHTYIYIGG
jgi:hypothetical protein